MSIPKNHHFVSQCHIKNFFNDKEGKLFLYDLKLDNFFFRTTTKSVFSEANSNTTISAGILDYSSLEKELKDEFEDKFAYSYQQLIKLVMNPQSPKGVWREHLLNLVRYGAAGELRPPEYKVSMDISIQNLLFNIILPNAAEPLRQQFQQLKDDLSQVKHHNRISYAKFADRVILGMEPFFVEIIVITTNDHFLLPDRPSITSRAKINNYFNPDIQEIAIIGIPLSSKVYLNVVSKAVREGKDSVILIREQNRSLAHNINKQLLMRAYKQIACESEGYLKAFISQDEVQLLLNLRKNGNKCDV